MAAVAAAAMAGSCPSAHASPSPHDAATVVAFLSAAPAAAPAHTSCFATAAHSDCLRRWLGRLVRGDY